jgi:hypothetical protein
LGWGAVQQAQAEPPRELLPGLELIASPELAQTLPGLADRPREMKQWTVLVYLDGDNNLHGAAVSDQREMAQVGSDTNINIVVERDLDGVHDSARFYVERGRSVRVQGLGEVNMGDGATLRDFLEWGITHYPANRYALILWDHGGGWRMPSGSGGESWQGVCWDDHNGNDCLYTAEQAAAIQGALETTGASLAMLGYDCCLQGMIEIVHQMSGGGLAGKIQAVAASPATIPGDGWPYRPILTDLAANPALDGLGLADRVVARYGERYGFDCMSAYDLARAPAASAAVSALADRMMASSEWSMIVAARAQATPYDVRYLDLRRFAQYVAHHAVGGPLRSAAQAAAAALRALVHSYVCQGTYDSGLGLSVYFPAWKDVNALYRAGVIRWAADTHWDEFLRFSAPALEDEYEPDDTYQQATPIGTDGTPQHRNNFSVAHQNDWVYCDMVAGRTYTVATSNLGPAADTALRLYRDPTAPPLAHNDDGGGGRASRIAWTCPVSARYYVMEQPYSGSRAADKPGSATGPYATYDLSVTESPGAATPRAAQVTALGAAPTRGGQVAISFSLSAPAGVGLQVLNAAGRPVRTLCRARAFCAGSQELLWDLRTDSGTEAPSGAYLVAITVLSPDGSRSRAVTAVTVRK